MEKVKYLVIYDCDGQFEFCETYEEAVKTVKKCVQDYDLSDIAVYELGKKLEIQVSLV